jgi:Tol biopolymer transport system component
MWGKFGWSPDSQQFAYFDGNLIVVNIDGTHRQEFTLPPKTSSSPAWLADNQHVGFVHTDPQGVNQVMVIDLATQTIAALPLAADGVDQLAWSPDGKSLAYHKAGQIFLANADGTHAQPLVDGTNPVWSPDSQHLAFLWDDGKHSDFKGSYAELYVIGVDGSPAARVIGGRIQSPSWGRRKKHLRTYFLI